MSLLADRARALVDRVATLTGVATLTLRDRLLEAARCPGCGFTYTVEQGHQDEGFAPGTAWASIPDHWCCPDCGVREKIDFIPFDPEKVQA